MRSYSELEAIRPTSSNNWYNIGLKFWGAARFSQAIYCYRRAIEADEFGDASASARSLGDALRICGRSREALEVLANAREKFPLGALSCGVGMTNALFDLDRSDDALKNAEDLAKSYPNDWRPWDSLRYVYSRLSRHHEAAAAAQKAFEIAPEVAGLRAKATTFSRYLDTKIQINPEYFEDES